MAFNKFQCYLINIQSVGNKTNTIRNIIKDQELDICMLTETWLSNNVSDSSKIKEMTPLTHRFYHIPRENKNGGGVGLFVKKTYTVSVLNQQIYNSFEHINSKIKCKNKTIQTIIIYKPSNTSKRLFIDEFSNLLDTVAKNRNILICGDFNLHLDNISDYYVNEFIELLESHDLENIVDKPTSLQNHIIDLVIQNKENKMVHGVEIEPECVTSPMHKSVLFNINIQKINVQKKIITYRDKTNFDAELFIEKSVDDIKKN